MDMLHHMVILRNRNKIKDFFKILAWDCPFNDIVILCYILYFAGNIFHIWYAIPAQNKTCKY